MEKRNLFNEFIRKPDYVSKENFEKFMNNASDVEKNFEEYQKTAIKIAHRIIELLCDPDRLNDGTVYKIKDGFIFEVRNYRNKHYATWDFDIEYSTKLAELITYYHERFNEILRKCNKYIGYDEDHSSKYYDIIYAYHDEFKKHIGYDVNIKIEDELVEITATKV